MGKLFLILVVGTCAVLGYFLSLPALIILTIIAGLLFFRSVTIAEGLAQLVGYGLMIGAALGLVIMWTVAILVRWSAVLSALSYLFNFLLR